MNREPDGEGKIVTRQRDAEGKRESYVGPYWFNDSRKTITVNQYDSFGGKYEVEIPLTNIDVIKRRIV